jgi:hypothetical protein
VFFLQLKQDFYNIMRKSHFNDEFFSVVGAHNQQFFACSNEEKNKQKQQRVLALVLSLCVHPCKVMSSS